jgi:hypothetical protein
MLHSPGLCTKLNSGDINNRTRLCGDKEWDRDWNKKVADRKSDNTLLSEEAVTLDTLYKN